MLTPESRIAIHDPGNSLGGLPVSILLYVEDVDAQTNPAVAAGEGSVLW